MIVLLLIGLGLIFGSFVNAFVWRLKEQKNWVSERSECPHCHHVLAPKDLIPVISWLLLRGKCRYCGKPIPDSPLTELAVPLLFVASYFFWPMELAGQGLFSFVLWLVCIVGFVVLAVYDLRWFLLPDKVVFPLIGLAFFQVLAIALVYEGSARPLAGAAAGVLTISGLFYALYHLSKGAWIGFGDVKLGIVLGILAGGAVEGLLLLFVASVLGMIVSLPLVFTGKAHRRSHVPFGPFLIMALIVVQLFGPNIIDWYTGTLFLG